MYVSDGFWQALDAIAEPSVTNTFGASHTWFHLLSTDDLGFFPMRAVPISWIPMPGKYSSSFVFTSFAPDAVSISAMSAIMSFRIRASFSPVAQSILITGIPHLSFLVGSSEIMLA